HFSDVHVAFFVAFLSSTPQHANLSFIIVILFGLGWFFQRLILVRNWIDNNVCHSPASPIMKGYSVRVLIVCATSTLLAANTFGAPSIIGAVANFTDGTIAITGAGFGVPSPLVTLDNTQLLVTSHTATTIDANLPPTVTPGSYHLIVRNG